MVAIDEGISFLLFIPFFFFFFFLIGICNTYPRLISFCSSSSTELYPLSRHRCCINLLLFVPRLDLDVDDLGLLMTVLSTTAVTSFMSWVLAGDITADKGMPFLSVKICLFVPSLLPLSVGLFPVLSPLKATLWI